MASLIVITGRNRGYMFTLKEQGACTVGRDETCDFQIVDDRVSRRHFQVSYDRKGGTYTLVDAGSANGTYMNGQRVTQMVLREGNVIHVGDTRLIFTEREFTDGDTALNYFKERGETDRNTLVGRPGEKPGGRAEP